MERLLDAGHPFATLSVETLAREAGIARATFYLHFRDKGALVARLLSRISDEVVSSGGAWFRDASGSGPAQVRQAITGVVHTFKRHQAVLAAVAQMAPFDPEVAALHDDMMRGLCNASRRAIATVRAEGRAAPLADEALADLLSWIVELYCTRFVAGLDDAALEALVERLAHICASAILSPAAQTAAGQPSGSQGAKSSRSRKP